MNNFCTNCGVKLEPNAIYCTNCGVAVVDIPKVKKKNPRLAKIVKSLFAIFLVALGINFLHTVSYHPLHVIAIKRELKADLKEKEFEKTKIVYRFNGSCRGECSVSCDGSCFWRERVPDCYNYYFDIYFDDKNFLKSETVKWHEGTITDEEVLADVEKFDKIKNYIDETSIDYKTLVYGLDGKATAELSKNIRESMDIVQFKKLYDFYRYGPVYITENIKISYTDDYTIRQEYENSYSNGNLRHDKVYLSISNVKDKTSLKIDMINFDIDSDYAKVEEFLKDKLQNA